MAFYTVEANKQNDEWTHVSTARVEGDLIGGANRTAIVQWTTDGTQSAVADGTNTIYLVKLPEGARVDPTRCSVSGDGTMSATTATLDVGDSDDLDRYADGLDVQAAGLDLFTATGTPAALNTPYAMATSDRWVIATIATLTGAKTNGTTYTFRIGYTVPN